MIQLEFNFNERKRQTPYEWYNQQMVDKQERMTGVEWLANELHGFIHPEHGKDFLPILEKAKAIEEQRIKDAIMYALDEDGHTGEWKIKFANDYINNLKQTK